MQVVGKYELVSEIGRGATAIVYLANYPLGNEQVSVKLFHPAIFSDSVSHQRVQREFEVARLLQHPNIVPIREIIDDKSPALVMNYIEGKNLEDFQATLPYVLPEISVLIVIEILKALEYAHAKHVVHRDLKPSNILISTVGSVFVSDFGLARLVGDMTMTGTNLLVGTPDYVSPEQIVGDTVTPQSDLFSLGSILYFLTTGTRPFARGSLAATLHAIRNEDPEPPQRRNPKIPAELSRIINRALAKHPGARFKTALEFRQALENYLQVLQLGPGHLKLKDWIREPSGSTMEALSRAAEALVHECESAVRSDDHPLFLERLAHLSLKAPSSPGLGRLTVLYRARLAKTRRRKWAGGVVSAALVLSLVGFYVLTRSSGNTPEVVVDKAIELPSEVKAATDHEAIGLDEVAPRPPKKKTAPPPPSPPVVVKPTTGSVDIRVISGTQIFWDYKEILQDTLLTNQSEGPHELIINRPGYDLIRRSVKIIPGQVMEIRAHE